jgi:Nif-specific regulatory protein
LEAVSGPLQGQAFPLAGEEVSIGREPSNRIAVLDSLVSRRHCVIRRDGAAWRLEDRESRNNTFVNGVPVKERTLAHADQIRVGNSVFVFQASDDGGPRLETAATPGGSTILLRTEDALYLRPRESEVLPATARTVRDLNVLFRFSREINAVAGLAALQTKVLESLLELSAADRVAVLLLEDGSEELASVAAWDRRLGPNQTVQVSRTILDQVIEEGVAVLASDVAAEESLQDAESLAAPQVRSALAVPLKAGGKLLGAIYLDASTPQAHFDADLLQLVTALGNVAALAMEHARRVAWLEGENRRLEQELNIEHSMVGDSDAMKEVYQFIARVAGRDSTVLIAGESGTGKELVARAVHRNSARVLKPFVAINCAAIAETLLESELFGHEKGSFTGAVSQKKGKLETAEGGTVFLDEIGELAPMLQAKLLRVLQEREFERVGGTRPIKLDIRLIAATNRDLKEAARTGAFRQDLYYRLNVVSVRMPPLRERRQDILLLAAYFASRYAEKVKRRISGISPAARACLLRYDWPGNVRELENAIERAVVLGSTDAILPEDLPDTVLEDTAPEGEPATALHDGLREAKKALIQRAIEQAGGNYTEAAGLLGVHPNHLFRLIRTLHLKPKRQKAT